MKVTRIRYWGIATFILCVLGFIALSSCSRPTTVEVPDESKINPERSVSDAEGQRLTDVASRATMPSFEREEVTSNPIAEDLQKYVGRYHVEISCDDPIVRCDSGHAEFILNLLPDGSAHRIIIHLGKITSATNSQYRDDLWSYDTEANQIIIHRSNGVELFYDIDKDQNLMFSIEKTEQFSDVNKTFFSEGNPRPLRPYKLIKIKR